MPIHLFLGKKEQKKIYLLCVCARILMAGLEPALFIFLYWKFVNTFFPFDYRCPLYVHPGLIRPMLYRLSYTSDLPLRQIQDRRKQRKESSCLWILQEFEIFGISIKIQFLSWIARTQHLLYVETGTQHGTPNSFPPLYNIPLSSIKILPFHR